MGESEEQEKKERGVLSRMHKSFKNLVGNPAKHHSVKDTRSNEMVLHQGFLRKKNTGKLMGKAMESMNIRWKRFYVMITEKFIYYYKSDMSSSFVGKFSLYGYNVVRRVPTDDISKCPEFSLVVEHASQDPSLYKNHYFAATHMDECRTWIQQIRKGLMSANASLVPGLSSRVRADHSMSDISALEDPIYPCHEFRQPESGKDSGKDSDVESDADDYDIIPDLDELAQIPPPTPIRPKKAGYPQTSPSTESYIDFADPSNQLHKAPFEKHPPLPPIPDNPSSQQWTPSSPIPSTYAESKQGFAAVVSDLENAREKMKAKEASMRDTVPRGAAPNTPVHQQPFRPPIATKPVQPVKPRVLPEKIYWNYSKEEGNRQVKTFPIGVFLVRRGSIPGQLVLVISAGDGGMHSLRINVYSNGSMGLKSESAAGDVDRFNDVRSLVTFYKQNDIHLQNGVVQIRLKSALHQCEIDLRDD